MATPTLGEGARTGAALLLLAVAFRFFSFFPTVIDHDESTYLVIAQEMLRGQTYWVDIFDTKPPGIFLLYGGFILLAGKSIFLLRLLAALWVGLTAWGLYAVGRRWMPEGPGPWFAAVSYILMTSIFTFFGVSPNTEIYFLGFSVAALWLVTSRPWRWGSFLLAGLSLGMGIAIKQVAAFDALPLGLALLAVIILRAEQRWTRLFQLAGLTLMSLLPFAAIAAWYYARGYGEAWYFHQFELPARYLEESTLWKQFKFVGDFFLRFAPLTLLGAWAVVQGWAIRRGVLLYLLLWVFSAGVAVVLPGNYFQHYTIQFMPAMALLGGMAFHPAIRRPAVLSGLLRPRTGWAILGLLLATNTVLQVLDYWVKPDHRAEVLEQIRQLEQGALQPDVDIYTGDVGYQVLYFLLDDEPPVDYPHPSLLWEAEHRENFGSAMDGQLEQVLRDPPDYCLLSQRQSDSPIQAMLDAHYHVVDTVDKNVVLYKRSPSALGH